ncbi:MAG: helix-turn-helix domain-containing protein [Mangrovicoccus sp.]
MRDMALDPSKGFVALPLDLFDVDLSPGAFRTLVEFCRMANADGYCWPSLAQLSERLGRSRPAISGYIAELREAELLSTQTQRTANGFNYRLRYCLPFWARWKSRFAKSAVKKVERGVQPAECIDSKNQTNKNQVLRGSLSISQKLVKEWSALAGSSNYPMFDRSPEPPLIAKTKAALAEKPSPTLSLEELAAVLTAKGIDDPKVTSEELYPICKDHSLSDIHDALDKTWKPYWRRPPSPDQFKAMLAPYSSAKAVTQLLQSYLRRAERAGFTLSSPAFSGELIPSPAARSGDIRGYEISGIR